MKRTHYASHIEEDIETAISSISEGSTIRKASHDYGVFRQTLNNRIQSRETRAQAKEIHQKLSPVQVEETGCWCSGGEFGVAEFLRKSFRNQKNFYILFNTIIM